MLDAHLMVELRRAERTFRKRGQPALAHCAWLYRGHLADEALTGPNPILADNIRNCLNLAFGGAIHA